MPTQTQNLIPFPELQFFDNNGVPLNGGTVATFAADGFTPKPTYQDEFASVLNTNPIDLDSAGRAIIWGSGQYVFQVKDALGNLIYTQASADPVAVLNVSAAMLPVIQASTTAQALALLGAASAASAIPVGLGPLPWAGVTAPSHWLLCFGQAVSRSTYSALFAVIGTIYGAGDGSTTFNLPDCRGRVVAGADGMGGVAANRLTSASIGTAAVLGAVGGDQLAQQDTLTVNDPSHVHTVNVTVSTAGGTFGLTNAGAVLPTAIQTTASVTGISVTSGLTGAAQNIPPVVVANCIIFTGV